MPVPPGRGRRARPTPPGRGARQREPGERRPASGYGLTTTSTGASPAPDGPRRRRASPLPPSLRVVRLNFSGAWGRDRVGREEDVADLSEQGTFGGGL